MQKTDQIQYSEQKNKPDIREPDHTGKAYERLIARALADLFQIRDPDEVRQNTFLTGASGVRHEIDLLLEIPLKTRKGFLAVECKDSARPVFKEKIAAYQAVLEDLNAARKPEERLIGIVISRSGFQTGAIELAVHYGICLLEIREPAEKDWQEYTGKLAKECRRLDPKTNSLKEIDISLRSNEKLIIVPEKGKTPPEWDFRSPVIWEAESLIFSNPETGRICSLPDYLRQVPAKGNGTKQEINIETQGGKLTHLVKPGELAAERLVYSFEDLSGEAEETILWNGEKPWLVIIDPIRNIRGILKNRQVSRLPDPVREIHEQRNGKRIPEYWE